MAGGVQGWRAGTLVRPRQRRLKPAATRKTTEGRTHGSAPTGGGQAELGLERGVPRLELGSEDITTE